MSTTLTELELATRWAMSPKTLQSWRATNRGPEYRKLGKKVQYSLAVIEDYENQARTNVAFSGVDEILLYLQQTGQAGLRPTRQVDLTSAHFTDSSSNPVLGIEPKSTTIVLSLHAEAVHGA
ncbi:hypothetical protein ACHEXK_09975 [Limnohabitans sp. DCL3]|uniref:hypothetical protein n=1 Tax=Limnohabitans sp. DCL3 TaxID=3374103 RepID=UPI003A8AF1AE